MTTVTFQPSATAPFQFQATFDSNVYTVTCPYNLGGQRYEIVVADLSGNIVVRRPLIGSPPKISAALSWASGVASASLSSPHNIPVAAMAKVTISGTGTAYDGTVQACSTDSYTVTYALTSNPDVSPDGYYSQDIDLLDGYFQSSLVYRPSTGQFEF